MSGGTGSLAASDLFFQLSGQEFRLVLPPANPFKTNIGLSKKDHKGVGLLLPLGKGRASPPAVASSRGEVTIEPGIPARSHFVDEHNLAEVITEVFDNVIDRVKFRRAVHLNRKAL
jgi:hypothetical protein